MGGREGGGLASIQRQEGMRGRETTHRGDDEGFHARPRIVGILLDKARIDDIDDSINRNARFRDISREHHLRHSHSSALESPRRTSGGGVGRTFLAPSGVGSKILACISVGKFA